MAARFRLVSNLGRESRHWSPLCLEGEITGPAIICRFLCNKKSTPSYVGPKLKTLNLSPKLETLAPHAMAKVP